MGTKKLSHSDVVAIKAALKAGVPNKELAQRYHISPTRISMIKWGGAYGKS